jgi:3-dehydroquinate synthase
MRTIVVETSSKSYPVHIGINLIPKLVRFITDRGFSKIWLITDENVAALHLHSFLEEFKKSSVEMMTTIVPGGERAKTFSVFEKCHTEALQAGVNRSSLVLAFGGGAVGDLAGFVAATYMRGIPFIQVPTTLLAHDSAVGGKVAINHKLGKNMIGAFYQPESVFYDISYLKTLPSKEMRSGFAEAIKHALIQDFHFYHVLKEEINSIEALNEKNLEWIIHRGIEIKASIVKEDEKEKGIRAFLNFGHTLGHAIEANIGYGKITHGEAVLIGMIFALKLSEKFARLKFDIEEFIAWAQKLGYQTNIPSALNGNDLLVTMKKDKKTTGELLNFVLLQSIGNPVLRPLSEEDVIRELNSMMYN